MSSESRLSPFSSDQIEEWRQSTKYKVVLRSSSKEIVKGTFTNREDAESYMADLERSDEYDEWHDCLWLVEVSPEGVEKDLYGYT